MTPSIKLSMGVGEWIMLIVLSVLRGGSYFFVGIVPVSAILLGSLFHNEALETIHFVGMALIALGFSAIEERLWQRLS